jgi:hypothetical protein
MKTLQYVFFIFLGCSLMDCGPRVRANKNTMDGWHLHLCSNETLASRVWFEVSGNTNNETYESREIRWHRGQSTFIALPENMRNVDDLNLSVRTSGKKKARVCILYGDYVIKSIEVTGMETNKLSREGRDNCPC